ncbi:MAG: uroporphyrinogen-III synthase [Proteobacteria bacterium]|nr:uroporphyrinogen-III synthase [Pseudomonadota bacterium]HQR04304.1 uroporphyrinogen-III synthase [Rhodocyclaceae bacterium]
MTDQPLAGRHIVVTRPAGQASHLAEGLVTLGAHPVLFPVLSIQPAADPAPLRNVLPRLDSFDLAVFVSPNAVEHALPDLLSQRAWPAALRVATVGLSSEQALARHGLRNVIAPRHRFDSEALLALPELQEVAGWQVLVFRGDGGRELLGETLTRRGARVEYLSCYRRTRPASDPAPLLKHWEAGTLDAVTITSSEGLRNLHAMVGKLGEAWLRRTPTFVPHARIAEQAVALGHHRVVPTGPGDAGLLGGLVQYFAHDHESAR